MNVRLLLAAVVVTGYPLTAAAQPADDDLVGDDAPFQLIPKVPEGSELTVTLTPPRSLPIWSCTGTARRSGWGCLPPEDWFRGPGAYEVQVEWSRGKSELVRASATVAVTSKRATAVTVYGLESPVRLEVLAGTPKAPASASASGALGKDAIKGALGRVEKKMAGCYAGALADSPGLSTRVVTWFVIGTDGAVKVASAEGAPQHPALAWCMLAHLRALRFPSPRSGAVAVTYPWKLAPPR